MCNEKSHDVQKKFHIKSSGAMAIFTLKWHALSTLYHPIWQCIYSPSPFPLDIRLTVPHIEIWSKSPLLDKPYKIWVDVGANHVVVICSFLLFMSRLNFWPKSLHISRNHI